MEWFPLKEKKNSQYFIVATFVVLMRKPFSYMELLNEKQMCNFSYYTMHFCLIQGFHITFILSPKLQSLPGFVSSVRSMSRNNPSNRRGVFFPSTAHFTITHIHTEENDLPSYAFKYLFHIIVFFNNVSVQATSFKVKVISAIFKSLFSFLFG